MKLLHIDSAITGAHSVSRKITAQIVEAYLAQHSNIEVSYLDLAANAPAHRRALCSRRRRGHGR